MVNIPKNNSDKLIAKQDAARQQELDIITQQILDELKKDGIAVICCSDHNLCDMLEVAKQFKIQGYYCYNYNNHCVNQKAVCVRKTPMPESDITRDNRTWYKI